MKDNEIALLLISIRKTYKSINLEHVLSKNENLCVGGWKIWKSNEQLSFLTNNLWINQVKRMDHPQNERQEAYLSDSLSI